MSEKSQVLNLKLLNVILKRCEEQARDRFENLPRDCANLGLEFDDVLAIQLYTFELGTLATTPSDNLYVVLNGDLRVRNARKMEAWKPYLWYLMRALSKLPKVGGAVFRGVEGGQAGRVAAEYRRGRRVRWSAFTSTTTDAAVARDEFAGDGGVVFRIEQASGRSVRGVSYVTTEGEVLLSPNTTPVVVAVAAPTAADSHWYVDLLELETEEYLF
eukprot:TRINITY_DN1626_c0_g2_i4.p2 TRINITY_DN1626_c0_g2~~TRINITY_DN1626_c0_g2_i4.p2  ORF type:complete len:215 (+),score=63.20 TRINITY_DN1626_c0_g2_i4:1553-2197(+)